MKVIDGYKEAEKEINHLLKTVPNDMPWCWITTKGKLLLTGFANHSSKLISLFTDDLNPEDSPYVLKQISSGSEDYLNPEGYFEKYWIKVTRSGIYIPKNPTGKQKISLIKHIEEHKGFFFDDNERFECFNTFGYQIQNVHVLTNINNKIELEVER